MSYKISSLREAINILKLHRTKLEAQLGTSRLERLLFNLEEISLDIENISTQLGEAATGGTPAEKFAEILDFFQYGCIPHITGHLETIEELLEEPQNGSETPDEVTWHGSDISVAGDVR